MPLHVGNITRQTVKHYFIPILGGANFLRNFYLRATLFQ